MNRRSFLKVCFGGVAAVAAITCVRTVYRIQETELVRKLDSMPWPEEEEWDEFIRQNQMEPRIPVLQFEIRANPDGSTGMHAVPLEGAYKT